MTQRLRLAALSTTFLVCAAGAANAADILVGPTRTVKSLAAGVAAARAGDRVLLDAGTYLNDTAIVNVPITIEGAGTGATLSITAPIGNGKGILVVNANLTVRNVTFQGAQVVDKNGAGIRLQSGAVTVMNSSFINNQNGILTNPNPAATLNINGSRFTGNGNNDGYTHSIYSNEIGQLTISGTTFSGQRLGHSIKSRALKTTIVQTVIEDGVTGTSSYAIDMPNGGVAVIDGLTVTQGTKTTNPHILAYGAEGNLKATNSLTVRNSSFTNQLSSVSATGVYNFTTTVNAALTGNTFTGVPVPLRGPGTVTAAPTASTPTPTTTAPSTATVTLRQGMVFSTAQVEAISYLRFYNTGSTAGTVVVNLFNADTGAKVAQWQSPTIAVNATLQVPVGTIEAAAGSVLTKPQFYTVSVAPGITGTFQHIVYRSSPGSFSNLSSCNTGVTTNAGKLANVHSSVLDGSYPSSIVLYNSGTAAANVTLGVYDAKTGNKLGTDTTSNIPPEGQVTLNMPRIEAEARITPSTAMKEYTVKLESAFTGTVQHIVNNQAAGVLTDMTAACPLK
ncbi:MAG: hypothetical protein AB7E79_10290 [Rhodospirillaceae bacterium]